MWIVVRDRLFDFREGLLMFLFPFITIVENEAFGSLHDVGAWWKRQS